MGTYVVSFLLEPVEGVLGTISTVTGRRVHNTVGRIGTASTRDLWLSQGNIRGGSGDVALESSHIVYNQPMSDAGSLKPLRKEKHTLLTTAVRGVNPEPGAMAPSRRTWWHVCGDLEISEPCPHTRVVHAENGKVLGLNSCDIGLVGDGESTSSQIVKTLEQSQAIISYGKRHMKLTVAAIKISARAYI